MASIKRQGSVMLDSMTQLVPVGHEKPLRQAFYTAAAVLFTVACCTVAVYVYYSLEIFIKPLMWSLLCGSFLFPFKYSLNLAIQTWMQTNESKGHTLIIGVLLLPFSLFDSLAEAVGRFTARNWKILFSFVTGVAILYWIQLHGTLELVTSLTWRAVTIVWECVSLTVKHLCQFKNVVIAIYGCHVISVLVLESSFIPLLSRSAVPAQMCALIYLVCLTGKLQIPLGTLLFLLIIASKIPWLKNRLARGTSDEKCDVTEEETEIHDESKIEKCSGKNFHDGESVEDVDSDAYSRIQHSEETKKHGKKFNDTSSYFKILFIAFTVMMIWMHVWAFALLALLLVYWTLKQFLRLDLLRNFLCSQYCNYFNHDISSVKRQLVEYYEVRKAILLPSSTDELTITFLKVDKKLNKAVLESLPTITSTLVILILIVGSISFSIFFAVKVQQESFVLVQMTSELVNETVSKYPEYQSWLPDNAVMQESMDSVVDKIYEQGREWIKNQLHSSFEKEVNITLIESQALRIWDKAYHLWFNKSIASEKKLLKRQSDLLQSEDGTSGLFSGLMDLLNMTDFIGLLKDNMSALVSVMESVWYIFQTNMTVLFSSVTTVFHVLLSGGTAVVNFVLSTVVFFTALFYLLAGSAEQYLPVQWMGFQGQQSSQASPIATAFQDSVRGVFGASLKMACFYGLYTWLNHTALGCGLVYIPSLLATIFSVVPVFATYWACIPSVFELWLLRGNLFRGLVLILAQVLPTMFVDATIYSEMASSGGAHPYVTGLAVAGGLYYFGLEGAIIGPIVLCILLVAVSVYFRIISMPFAETLTSRSRTEPSE